MKNIILNMKENQKLKVIQEVMFGKETVLKASQLMRMSERHCYRLLSQVRKKGARGIMHGNRGKKSEHKISAQVSEQIIVLRKGPYAGFNDRHFTDELCDEEKIIVGRESVRKVANKCQLLLERSS